MDQVHVVRHKVLVEGQAVRRVAREMGIALQHGSGSTWRRRRPVRVEKATGTACSREGGPAHRGAAGGVAARWTRLASSA